MLKSAFVALALIGCFASALHARGPASLLAQPVYEDGYVDVDVNAVNVGSNTVAKLHSPSNQWEYRKITIENPSNIYNLKIATYSFALVDPSSKTWTVRPSTWDAQGRIELPGGTTYYGKFDNGAPSTTVRMLGILNRNLPPRQR